MSHDSSRYGPEATKDGQIVVQILKNIGISVYDPKVITRLLDFTYRYTTSILEEARIYSNHANKKFIDLDDVKLAIKMISEKAFTDPPSREMLLELAFEKNKIPLPSLKTHCGLALPPATQCFTNTNYRLKRQATIIPPPFVPFNFPVPGFNDFPLTKKLKKRKSQDAYNELLRQAQLNLAIQNQMRFNFHPQYRLPNPCTSRGEPKPFIPQFRDHATIQQFQTRFNTENMQ